MKATLLLLALASVAAPAWALEPAIPDPFPEARYQTMVARSPFALATPLAPTVTPDKSFADGWYLGGFAHFDGRNLVTVKSRDLSVQFSLRGDERKETEGSGHGVKLQSVEWSPVYGRTTATIEKDGQIAKLEQNQADLASAAPPVPSAMNPAGLPRPATPNNPSMRQPPSAYPMPQNRNVIPRPSTQPIVAPQPAYSINPGAAQNAAGQPINPGVAPAAAPGGEGRRRIRMINSAPAQ